MKKILLSFIFITGFVNAQIVNIPDANFKAKLLEASPDNEIAKDGEFNPNNIKIDINDDGEIQESEALNVYRLNINNSSISDLTGIEAFSNLRTLECNNNQLTSLDVSQNTFGYLDCSYNQITSLDLSLDVGLYEMDCSNNQLTSLEMPSLDIRPINVPFNKIICSNNLLTNLSFSNLVLILDCSYNQLVSLEIPYVIDLNCSHNQIVSLDLSNNDYLENLRCNHNQLTSLNLPNSSYLFTIYCNNNNLSDLDLSNPPNLNNLMIWNNQLTNLDVSKRPSLIYLFASNNKLTNLDFSNNPRISRIGLANNLLTELNIKNGQGGTSNGGQGEYIGVEGNLKLNYICADQDEIDFIQEQVDEQLEHNVLVGSYCSFTPGGEYNTISGTTTFDKDSNGCDSGDTPRSYMKIGINDGTNEEFIFTNNYGDFSFYTNTGSYSLTPEIENASWFAVTPSSIDIDFSSENNILEDQNFCIGLNGVHNDLEIVLSPIETARPGFDATYKIVYKNIGNKDISGSLDFTYNNSVLDYISATVTPDVQSFGNLSWNYNNLQPFESRSLEVTLNVNSPREDPAINNGDVLSFTATINPVSGDENEDDNVFQLDQVVVGSYDPNDIICLEGDTVLPEEIGEYLHYTINFENTGTAAATFVIVNNVVDLSEFDMSTLQILDASHSMETKIIDNKIEFIFDNINLGASEKGNIIFKIKSLNTLVVGDNVSKKADIFFDYNFPIETNIASTTFQETLSNEIVKVDNGVTVFPNPVKSELHINAKSFIKSIEIYDTQGRVVITKLVNEKDAIMNISNFRSGVYFLKVKTENGEKVERLIKD